MKKMSALGLSVVVLTACNTPPQNNAPTATATLRPASGSQVRGHLTFTQLSAGRVRVTGEVSGHQPGMKGFHLHEKGDCSAPDAMSAGGHFNPGKAKHGASPATGHAGDMGNLAFTDAGRVKVDMTLEGISVNREAANGIIGRAVVIHLQADDLKTDPTGNAGGRAACGVIS